MGELVCAVIEITAANHAWKCATLACALLQSPQTSEAAHVVANEACIVILGAKPPDALVPSSAEMVFRVPSCSEQKTEFLEKAKEVSAVVLAAGSEQFTILAALLRNYRLVSNNSP